MVLSVDDIVAKFPVKTLTHILGKPDYANIIHMIKSLYGNAAFLPSPLRGGAHGHVRILKNSLCQNVAILVGVFLLRTKRTLMAKSMPLHQASKHVKTWCFQGSCEQAFSTNNTHKLCLWTHGSEGLGHGSCSSTTTDFASIAFYNKARLGLKHRSKSAELYSKVRMNFGVL
jgi:hypothetical protein